ncbi:MAG: MBL fold metallo-hydrolase [Bacteroidales bacterium]|nr:MBL fold metallo-hydrolase [Bacteroidales bacterium]
MKLHSFNIANFRIDGGAMFGVVPKLIWSNYIEADDNNLIPLALRSLVIETHGRIILIDNGIGDKQGKKFLKRLNIFGGEGLEGGLARGGYSFSDITDVILTHLHFDHCGGSIMKNSEGQLTPTFPNAKYWVSKTQWNNAMNPNPREADSFLPENLLPIQEAGVLMFIEQAGEFCSGVELRLVDGHTPGQIIPVITIANRKLIYGADLFPTKAHIPVKYNMAYDLEVTKTMEEKTAWLNEFADTRAAFFFEHDTQSECGQVSNTERGFKVTNSYTLNEWLSLP